MKNDEVWADMPYYFENREGYSAIPRYTYIIEREKTLDDAWNCVSLKYRNKIKKEEKVVL